MARPLLTPAALVQVAHRLKAMADPKRLHILQLLAGGELCVGELVARLDCTQANVSKHLGVLRAAGLVRPRREGMNVYYAVVEPVALEVCHLMCGCLEREASRTMAQVRQPAARAEDARTRRREVARALLAER
jgi:DNA-binding transcriptional ArsR family regulator